MQTHKPFYLPRQAGFSLIEILVGMVIGLLASLVIMQVFAVFEGQKRTTTGGVDAQTNGTIATFAMQREILMAGYGLPLFETRNPPMRCTAFTPGGTSINPITVTDGAAGASDTITIRYGTSQTAGIPVTITPDTLLGLPGMVGTIAHVDNHLGCQLNDVVLVSSGTNCAMTSVTAFPDTTHVTLEAVSGAAAVTAGAAVNNASLACITGWGAVVYGTNNNQLVRNGAPSVAGIVNIQAQYGIAAVGSNQVTNWVNATGATWAAPTPANRNRIKAVRIAVVTRNGQMEKNAVTAASCTTAKGTVSTGPCAWDDTNVDAAPQINLSNDPDWRRYRYRVFEVIIPLRNVIWTGADPGLNLL